MNTFIPYILRSNVICVSNALTHQQPCYATNINIMTLCLNVKFVAVASSLRASFWNTKACIKYKGTGCVLGPNVGKGLNGSPILTRISCHMVKRNTCVINAHTRTLIPATYEHIKGGTVMHYHLNVRSVEKDSNGYSSVFVT